MINLILGISSIIFEIHDKSLVIFWISYLDLLF